MKTLIICDRESRAFDGFDIGAAIQTSLLDAGVETEMVTLDGNAMHPCLGCFYCWVKTPGMCRQTRDAANAIARAEIQSDAIVLVSRITYGGYSYDTKSLLDRTIQNLGSFFEIVDGTMRHSRRYDRFPSLISLGYGACTDQEAATFVALTRHNALNMRPPRHAVFTAQDAAEANQAVQSLTDTLTNAQTQEARP